MAAKKAITCLQFKLKVWSRERGKKNITAAQQLNSIPPTSEVFREYFQSTCSKRGSDVIHDPDPQFFDATNYGWSSGEFTETLDSQNTPTRWFLATRDVRIAYVAKWATDEFGTQRYCHTTDLVAPWSHWTLAVYFLLCLSCRITLSKSLQQVHRSWDTWQNKRFLMMK